MMRKAIVLFLFCYLQQFVVKAQSITSPDGHIQVIFSFEHNHPYYEIWRGSQQVLLRSEMGFVTQNPEDNQQYDQVSFSGQFSVNDRYTILNAKKSNILYHANKGVFTLLKKRQKLVEIVFQVSDDGVAFRYHFINAPDTFPQIVKELTNYHFARHATAWLQPKAVAKTGFEHTNPSYEENYTQNIPVGTFSASGWVYPALFRTGGQWALITEAGMDGSYCGTSLYNRSGSPIYSINFPDEREVFPGGGALPKNIVYTPWRVIVIGSLKTIVESTLGTDLAKPEDPTADHSYIRPGKSSWSWIMSKDDSINYRETKRYIDFASKMKWQYCLIDAGWDTRIGYDKVRELSDYAAHQQVGLLLWYNSAGDWNTVKLTPRDKLLTRENRDLEFSRLHNMGIKGIKIDFFGGDGQSMIQYYIDILQSALKYQLLVNFHGATIPRGWARTYPNLMTSEAVKGFEMITFSQRAADEEADHCAMLPFTRNAFDPMDFTPMNLYKIPNSVIRKTTGSFELATSILFLSGIQHYAESPEGMSHMPPFVINFLKELPDHWEDVRFVDGFPGKFAVIARKGNGKWYVAAINGSRKFKELTLDLSPFRFKRVNVIRTNNANQFRTKRIAIPAGGKLRIRLKGNDGIVIAAE